VSGASGDGESAILAGAIATLIARAEAATGVAARRYARALLERGLYAADPGVVDATLAERARAVGVSSDAIAAARRPRSPHAVGVPLVADDGTVVVRAFEVVFEPVDERATFDEAAEAACRAAIARATERLVARPDARRYRFVPCSPVALAEARVDGDSLGAACFVSALSLFTDRPVRQGVVVTGALSGERVVGVGATAAKVAAARAAGAAIVVVPEVGAPAGAVGVGTLDALATAALEEVPASTDPDRLVARATEAARDGWSGYRWRPVREAATRALAIVPEGRPELRVEALAELAAATRHLGDLAGSGRAIELATELAESPLGKESVPDAALCRLARQRAMTEKSRARFAAAARAAARSVAIARKARLRGELVKSLGVLGLVAMAQGDDRTALPPLEESLAITLARTPTEAARSRAYLIELFGRLGELPRAEEHTRLALAECAAQGERGRAKEGWVRTSFGAACVHAGAHARAREALDHPAVHAAIARDPLPGLLARRWLGLSLVRTGERARGLAMLSDAAIAYGAELEPSLRFLADLCVLHALAVRDEPPEREIVEAVVRRVASFEGARRALRAELSAVKSALRAEDGVAAALERLALGASRLV
jgi:hypothetical protein